MSEESVVEKISRAKKCKLLLQYILRARGVVHEHTLLKCLMTIDDHENNDEERPPEEQLKERLSQYIAEINVNLSALNYRVVRATHGMGRSYVSRQIQAFGGGGDFSASNRFYVYVNVTPSKEAELATVFKPSEIEFIKWMIECLVTLKAINETSDTSIYPVEGEIDRVLREWSEREGREIKRLRYWTTYSAKSIDLLNYVELSTTDVERLLAKLCELKWIHKTDNGLYELDLKMQIELADYLIESHSVGSCQTCQRVVMQGVLCTGCVARQNADDSEVEQAVWHVDCFEYNLNHRGEECNLCEVSLVDACAYLV